MTSTERDACSSSVPAMRPPGSPRMRGTWQAPYIRAAGERPPRARPQRRGSPGPIPNPAVKPAFAESTAAPGCGRAGRRARGGRFSICRGGDTTSASCTACVAGLRRRIPSQSFLRSGAVHRRGICVRFPCQAAPAAGPAAHAMRGARRRTEGET